MKKLPVLCFVLAGFAVRCDDANYYIIKMPDEGDRTRPFQVYWNVPTMQCSSKKIPFDDLDAFGIIQNDKDSFRGNKIAILYDPGRFPALLKNESGAFKFRNGGVPQEGNLTLHLDSFRDFVEQSIPDENFNGIAVIDFESWKPVLRQNFGELVPYKDISYEIERKKHKWWLESWIKEEAKNRFEESGRIFMQNTISLAKRLRPRATWGYYGFPYCYNMAADRKEECSVATQAENDNSYWLWAESAALYPSMYSSKSLTTSQLTSLVRGRVKEASRLSRRHTKVLPYLWFRYRDGGYLEPKDLAAILETLFNSEASGFVLWGSSNDVRTKPKCEKLHKYVYNILGPAIANFTKRHFKDDSYTVENENTEENNLSYEEKISIDTDPEYNWVPPVNYTQDIKRYVDEEYKNEKVDNITEIAEEVTLIELINKMLDEDQKVLEAMKGDNKGTKNDNTVGSNHLKNYSNTESNKEKLSLSTDYPMIATEREKIDQTTIIYAHFNSTNTESPKDIISSKNIYNEVVLANKSQKSTNDVYHLQNSTSTEVYGTSTNGNVTSSTNTNEELSTSETTTYNNDYLESTTEQIVEIKTDKIEDTDSTSITTQQNNYLESTTWKNEEFDVTTLINKESSEFIASSSTTKTEFEASTDLESTTEQHFTKEDSPSSNTESETEQYNDLSTTTKAILKEKDSNLTRISDKIDVVENNTTRLPKNVEDLNSTALTESTADKVSSSGPSIYKLRYSLCLFFYFYSIAQCFCELYDQC